MALLFQATLLLGLKLESTLGRDNPVALVLDSMARRVEQGWGAADLGGAYQVSSDAQATVTPGDARLDLTPAAKSVSAMLPDAKGADVKGQVALSLPRVSATGPGVYVAMIMRATGDEESYHARLRAMPNGGIGLSFSRLSGGTEEDIGTETTLPVRFTEGQRVVLEAQVTGTDPVTMASKVWLAIEPEPVGWQHTVTDHSTHPITSKGSVGIWSSLVGDEPPASISIGGWRVDPVAPDTQDPSSGPESVPGAPATSLFPTPEIKETSNPSPSPPTRTAEPSTSPTSAPTGGGSSKPGPGNTGVPAGTDLTVHYGDITITKDGTVLDRMDIHGYVRVEAANVTIKRSIIRGGKSTVFTSMVMAWHSNVRNLVIEDSELAPDYPSVYNNGIIGSNYTLRRVNMHSGVDGAEIHNGNVTIEDSWIHDVAWFPSDPAQGGGPTHSDAIQILGGSNIRITNNTITVSTQANAGLQVTQGLHPVTGVAFTWNWVDGGMCSVNLSTVPLPSMTGITVSNNRFGRNTSVANCAIVSGPATTLVAEGNIWMDNGQPVAITRGR